MNRTMHPLQCIVPPHMLEEIERNGTERQKQVARNAQSASREIRRRRIELMAAPEEVSRLAAVGKDRVVFDARRGIDLPGTRTRGEDDAASGDAAVDEAFDGAGATYDLYRDEYGRDSIDGHGMRLDSTVHYRVGYDNAFWNGHQMVYGDGDEDLPGDERLFNRFTAAIEIIGHELTHGVVQFSANLVYENQPGALNESFADVFGALVKQRTLNQSVDEADWLIGAGLFTGNVNGGGIRSMKAPGTAYDDPVLGSDPQPGHMNDFVHTQGDHGGVHINSGIPNHAFYVTARELGGRAWETAGRIWYATLSDRRLDSRSDFEGAASLTATVAGELFGSGSREQRAVMAGWSEVGVPIEAEAPEEEDGGDGEDRGGEDRGDGGGTGCALALLRLPLRPILSAARG